MNVGTWKEALKGPNEEVLKSLRTQYPRQTKGGQQVPKWGGKSKGKDKTGKNDWGSRGRSDDWSPVKPMGQRRATSDRSRSRERKDTYKRDGQGGKNRDKDGGRGGTGKGSLDPRVRRSFTICKDKKEGKCPFYQYKTCQYSSGRCNLGDHKCFLCGGKYGAIDCNKLSSEDTRKKLGM